MAMTVVATTTCANLTYYNMQGSTEPLVFNLFCSHTPICLKLLVYKLGYT
jgi:hypothetical protein